MSQAHSFLVTGASGFLGSHLVRTLVDRGITPRVLVRSETPLNEFLQTHTEVYRGDLRDPVAVAKATTGIEVIYHCAALVQSSGHKEDFFECNVRGTEHLLAAAKNNGAKKIVYVSSVAVYGPGKQTIVRESDCYDPLPQQRGYYTWSKIEADRLVQQFSQEQELPVTILRPGIIYGPGAKPFFARLHYNLKGKVHVIIGHPSALLPLVFAGSVVEAITLAGQRLDKSRHVYNIVDGAITQKDYLHLQGEAMGKPLRVIYLSPSLISLGAGLLEKAYTIMGKGTPSLSRYRIQRACQSVAHDTTKARKELGWRPVASLPQGLIQSWQWWQNQRRSQLATATL